MSDSISELAGIHPWTKISGISEDNTGASIAPGRHRYGFSDFIRILQYVAARCGTTVVRVDKFFPSSQLCYGCGFKNKAVKSVLVREWDCPEYGMHHDRDRNAAKNILKEGLRIFEAS